MPLTRHLAAALAALTLAAAPLLAAPLYDECPAGMTLKDENCLYAAGDLTRPGFTCDDLTGKFGSMDCSASAGSMCDAWAVRTCEKLRPECLKRKRALTRGARLPDVCLYGVFTILDPQKKPTPAYAPDPVEKFARENDLSFRDQLVLQYSADMSRPGPRLPLPDANVSLPQDVKDCLASPDARLDEWTKGAKDFTRPTSNYRLRRSGGLFEFAVNIRLTYAGAPENRTAVAARVLGAVGCVERFFARHHIKLDLGLSVDDASWSKWWNADISDIKVWDSTKQSNSANWGILNDFGQPMTEGSVCGTMVHELAHRLGLPDRYQEPNNPPNPHLVPDSEAAVMKYGGWETPDKQTLTDDDLRILTTPLCRKMAAPVPSPHPTPTPR